MKSTFPLSIRLAATLFCAAPFVRGQIQTYTVPKEHPPVAPPPGVAGMAPGDAMSSQQVPVAEDSATWKAPAGWQDLGKSAMRVGSFSVAGADGKKAEVAITHFPGSVGGELSNVNRWRRELGLPEIDESGITSEAVTVDGSEGKLYNLEGAAASTVVADIPHNGASWFFKLRGDKEVVASTKAAFLEFLKSVKFSEGGAAASSMPPTASDPHAGMNMAMGVAPAPAVATDSGAGGNWNAPANWHERAPGPMLLKSYTVGDGAAATVTISSFPGAVGGELANVNRWRGQLGLGPITEDALPNSTQSIDIGPGKGTLVDLTGVDGKTGKPARLVAVMVPRDGNTWFFKLLGDGGAVGMEKDAFVKFVQTAHNP